MISTAMLLAAGLGTRMRPLTNTLPKPLIPVVGKTMLARLLAHLNEAKISKIVVNTHYLAPLLHEALPPSVFLSPEETLLETGGGVRKALPLLGNSPFFVINLDNVWLKPTLFRELEEAWDEETMDVLLLLTPRERCYGYEGRGDFFLSPSHHLNRPEPGKEAPYVYGGIHIVHPRLFKEPLPDIFSLNLLWDKAIQAQRLSGYIYPEPCYHIGTPEALALCEPLIQKAETLTTGS